MELNKYIDHTNLKNTGTLKDIEKLCNEAIKYKFASVCVYPYYVPLAASLLKDTNVEVCTVIGFPSGVSTKETKVLKNVTYYPKNIYENEYVEIYRYKELYYYHNGSINNIKFSISDIYKNTLGAFVDDYFLAPIIRENRLAGYNIINVVSGEERKFEFNEKKYEADIFLPKYNVAIEYDGAVWHKEKTAYEQYCS